MSKENYVQLNAVREALEQVIKNENEIEKVLAILNETTVAVETAKQEDMTVEESVFEEETPPKLKMQYVILVSDPDGIINKDLTGWILQIPEQESCLTIVDNIKTAAYNFNASKKGRMYPVNSIGQAIEGVPTKFFKPYNTKVKTKEAVFVVTTNNILPKS